MKKAGYILFAIMFNIYSFFGKLGIVKLNKKKAFFVMTHETAPTGNLGIIKNKLLEMDYQVITLTRKDEQKSLGAMVRFFFKYPLHLATANYVFMDNVFLPMAYIKMRPTVVVAQLWHGTGTIKKFGQDVNKGELYRLEKKSNERITHLFVGSEYYKRLYAGCFSLPNEKIYVTGLPRTDVFFDDKKVEQLKEKFFKDWPKLSGKQLVLLAPTFRDNSDEAEKIKLDLQYLSKNLKEDYVIILRLHPFVRGLVRSNEVERTGKVYDLSEYDNLNALLVATDCLVTDYSSIIFEYMLMNKKMYFYAYDLADFSSNGRGFYKDYESNMPGAVVKNIQELCDRINRDVDLSVLDEYQKKKDTLFKETYQYTDGKSLERIFETIGLEK